MSEPDATDAGPLPGVVEVFNHQGGLQLSLPVAAGCAYSNWDAGGDSLREFHRVARICYRSVPRATAEGGVGSVPGSDSDLGGLRLTAILMEQFAAERDALRAQRDSALNEARDMQLRLERVIEGSDALRAMCEKLAAALRDAIGARRSVKYVDNGHGVLDSWDALNKGKPDDHAR